MGLKPPLSFDHNQSWKRLHESTSRMNPEPEFRQAAWGFIRSRPGNYCDVAGTNRIGYCFPIGSFQWRGEGGFAAWVTVHPPYLLYLGFAYWRGHSSFAIQRRHNKVTQQFTGYKFPARLAQSVTPGVSPDGERGHRISFGSYHPP